MKLLISSRRNGDTPSLAAMTGKDTFSGRFVQRALLDGRNPGLADGIDKLSRASPDTFVGIGTLRQ